MSVDEGFWNGIAKDYAVRPVRDEAAYAYTLERVSSYLAPSARVLELGGGTGTTAVKLAPSVADYTVTDLSSSMLEIAKDRAARADVANLSIQTAVPQTAPMGPFNVILAMNLLHLLPNLREDLRAIHARLPVGGMFISKSACLASAPWFKRVMTGAMIPTMQLVGKAPKIVHRLSIKDLEAMIQAAGFEIIETGNYPADTPSRFVAARKL